MYDPHTKDSRGFGFVMMMNPEGAARAIDELSGKEFMGKVMTVAHVRIDSAATARDCQIHSCMHPFSTPYYRPVVLEPGPPPREGTTGLPRLVFILIVNAVSYH